MKKLRRLFGLTLLVTVLAATSAFALTQKQLQFVDEWGDPVNMGTSVSLYIYNAGTTTEQTCYLDPVRANSVTQPVEDDSTNTPLDYTTGLLTFFSQPGSYKIYVTDGTYTRTVDNLTGSDTRIAWPSYLSAISSYNLGQNNDLDFTYGDWIVDGDTSGRLDMIPDSDGGILGIGDGTAQADVYIYAATGDYIFFDEGNARCTFADIDGVWDDDAHMYFGSDRDVDFKFANGTDTLTITHTGGIVAFGSDDDAPDVYFYCDSTGDYTLFDEDNAEIYCADIDIQLDDDAKLIFGSGDDVSIYSDTADTLTIDPGAAGDTLELGSAYNDAFDVLWYGDTSGDTVTFDEENCDVDFVDIDLDLDDDSYLRFGSTDDITIKYYSSGDDLDILGSGLEVSFGVTDEGIDVIMHGETSGEYFMWDESADTVKSNCGNALFTMTDAEGDQFKIDATGTIDGDAINFETTDGGVMVNADGASNGDIELNAADDIMVTAAGDLTLGITGTFSAGGAVMTNQKLQIENVTADDTLTTAESGKIFYVENDTDGIVLTLPSVGASDEGTYYIIVDANEVAASDVTIEPADSDTINGTADGFSSDGADELPCAVMIIYDHDQTDWFVLPFELGDGTAAWDCDS